MNDARALVDAIKASRPNRQCSGGPNGHGWCGKSATVVCTATAGLQWYACDDEAHREGATTMPMAEWWTIVDGLGQ